MPALESFRYERPNTLEQLKELLSGSGFSPCYLAGGTDLLVAMRTGKERPSLLIDIKGLPGLSGIKFLGEEKIWIGSLSSIHSLEVDTAIRRLAEALFEGARNLGSLQVRNRGTIGGNLANGAPTADTAAPLLALDATILIWGPQQERRLPIDSFWLGAKKTSLKNDEIITGVEIPLKNKRTSAYLKLGPREAMDIAAAGAAAAIELDGADISRIRIALSGAAPTPLRPHSAEEFLIGRPATLENIQQAGKLAAGDSNPRTSSRATREYRLSVIPVLVERAIRAALQRQEAFSAGQGGQEK